MDPEVARVEQTILNTLRSQTKSVRDAFRKLDISKNGKISVEELRVGLQQYNYIFETSILQALVAKYDIDGSGCFNYDEFSNFYEGKLTQYLTSSLGASNISCRSGTFADVFLKFDIDRNGRLSHDEVRFGMETLGIKLTATETLDLFDTVKNKNSAGEIDLYEFFALLQRPLITADTEPKDTIHGTQVDTSSVLAPVRRGRSGSFLKAGAAVPVSEDGSASTELVELQAEEAVRRMVKALDERRIALRTAFKSFDLDGSGTIDSDQLKKGLLTVGIELSDGQ
eukprot:gene4704-5758_t